MEQWTNFLKFQNTPDGILRLLSVVILSIVLIKYSTVFENEYSQKLIDLYLNPWWRILVLLLFISAVLWCPRVGMLVALVVFFYLSDMETLITPFANL
jgi:hypothetical protein